MIKIRRNSLQLEEFAYFLCPFPAFTIDDRTAGNFLQYTGQFVDLGIDLKHTVRKIGPLKRLAKNNETTKSFFFFRGSKSPLRGVEGLKFIANIFLNIRCG